MSSNSDDFYNLFVDDSIKLFGCNISQVQTIYSNIRKIDSDAKLLDFVKSAQRLVFATPDAELEPMKVINISIEGKRSDTRLTSFEYHLFVAGLYVHYTKSLLSTNAQVNLRHLPFQRIVIDVDVPDSCDTEYVEIVETCKRTLCATIECDKSTLTTTTRRGANKSFHIITNVQVDSETYKSVLNAFDEAMQLTGINVKIDHTRMWTCPGGRNHLTSHNNDMSWIDFKKISVVDVWSFDNFKTCLTAKTFGSRADIVCSVTITTDNDGEYAVDYANQKTIPLHLKPFFTLIFDCTECLVRFDSTGEFTKTTLKTFRCKRKSSPLDALSGDKNDDEQEKLGADGIEFFECLYNAKTTFLKHPRDFIKSDFTPQAVDLSDLPSEMHEINDTKKIQSDPKREAIRFLMETCRPSSKEFKENMDSVLCFSDREYPWDKYTDLFFSSIEDKYFIFVVIHMYVIYCEKHNLERACSHEYIGTMMSIFANRYGFQFNDRDMDTFYGVDVMQTVDPADDETAYFKSPDTTAMFKHILTLMMNSGAVATAISMLLRAKLFKKNHLNLYILMLSTLELTEHAKFLLFSYVSGEMSSYILSMTKVLTECFTANDIIYFLSDVYQMDFDATHRQFYSRLPSAATPICEPPKPKKRKKGDVRTTNEDDKLKTAMNKCFHKYILFYKRNVSFNYIFENNKYHEVAHDDHRLTHEYAGEFPEEPMLNAHWYRMEPGIKFPITQQFELNMPSLFNLIYIETYKQLTTHGLEVFNPNNFALKNLYLDCILKAPQFIDFAHLQRMLLTTLGPIFRDYSSLKLPYHHNSVQIRSFDLNNTPSTSCMQENIDKADPIFIEAMTYLYLIVCEASINCKIDLTMPSTFIEEVGTVVDSNVEHGDKEKEENTEFFIPPFNPFKNPHSSLMIESMQELDRLDVVPANVVHNDSHELSNTRFFKSEQALSSELVCPYFNRDPALKNMSLKTIDKEMFNFLFNCLSWFIRYEHDHTLSNHKFFQFIEKHRVSLYDSMKTLVLDVTGPVLINSGFEDMVTHFRSFCENTTVEIDKRYQDLVPVGYTLGDTSYDGPFRHDVFNGVMAVINHAQYSTDAFIDLLRMIHSFTFKGNHKRRLLGLFKRTGTGKNYFLEQLIETAFRTNIRQCFVNDDLKSCEKETGNMLARSLNGNLVAWFDEVVRLPMTVKALVGVGKLSERSFHISKDLAEYRINSHVIISSNNDPKCDDPATVLRIAPMSRTMQYGRYSPNEIFLRENGIEDTTMSKINKYVGAQLMLSRLPASGEMNGVQLGLFQVIHLMSDINFYTFSSPVSRKLSSTMENRILNYLYASQPAYFLVDSKLVVESRTCISLTDFRTKAANLFNNHKTVFGGSVDVKNAVADLEDLVSPYIKGDNIYVNL